MDAALSQPAELDRAPRVRSPAEPVRRSPSPSQGQRPAPLPAPDSPWWFAVPKVFLTCARLTVLPVFVLIHAAEAAVAAAVLGVLAIGGAWWFGYLTDAEIVAKLQPVGQRLLAMVQSAANR